MASSVHERNFPLRVNNSATIMNRKDLIGKINLGIHRTGWKLVRGLMHLLNLSQWPLKIVEILYTHIKI